MRIAHFSDTHLMSGPLAPYLAASVAQTIGRLLALTPRPDCVVITGDLADSGHPDEYAALHAILKRCPVPVHLAVGNHDDPTALVVEFGGTRFLGGGTSTSYVVEYPEATIVVTDSRVDGSPAGHLGSEQLAWLDDALAARPDVPALVCVHHPPIPVGIPLLDDMRLQDGPDLAEVIARHRNVVRVLSGHAHRTITAPFAGSLLSVAPSTYKQIDLQLHDTGALNYLAEPTSFLLHLLDGTTCVTHSVAVSHTSAAYAF